MSLRLPLITALLSLSFLSPVERGLAQSALPSLREVSFNAMADSGQQDWENSVLEIVYIGPTNKLFPSIALSSGPDVFDAHDAMQRALKNTIPPAGLRRTFRVPFTQMRGAIQAISKLDGTTNKDALVGLYAMQTTTGRIASIRLADKTGRSALDQFAELTAGPARDAFQKLTRMIYPPAN